MELRTSSGIPVFRPMLARWTMSILSPSWKLWRPAIARSVVGVSTYSANAKPYESATITLINIVGVPLIRHHWPYPP